MTLSLNFFFPSICLQRLPEKRPTDTTPVSKVGWLVGRRFASVAHCTTPRGRSWGSRVDRDEWRALELNALSKLGLLLVCVYYLIYKKTNKITLYLFCVANFDVIYWQQIGLLSTSRCAILGRNGICMNDIRRHIIFRNSYYRDKRKFLEKWRSYTYNDAINET